MQHFSPGAHAAAPQETVEPASPPSAEPSASTNVSDEHAVSIVATTEKQRTNDRTMGSVCAPTAPVTRKSRSPLSADAGLREDAAVLAHAPMNVSFGRASLPAGKSWR